MKDDTQDVLEQNVSTLIETGGEPPRISDIARARIRAHLVDKHGVESRSRLKSPLVAVGIGLVATAAAALIITRFVGGSPESTVQTTNGALADGTTWIMEPGAKVDVLGPRRVRVAGAALLDVAPGKGQFVVETARGRVEVLGTRFLVDAGADRTTTAVVRGQVKLATDAGDVVLHAGEQGVAEAGRPPTRGPAPRLTNLVSWARAARKRDEHAVQPLRNGTLFAREPNNPHVPESPLPITKLGVDVVVEDQVARVAIDQTFNNPAAITMEGMYRFAIPPDAALQRLAMYVNGELQESAVVERMRARRIYEEIVYRRLDPALLEWAGTGRLALRVYPLPPREDKRLVLAYTQSLPKLYDDWTLTVPLPEVDLPVGELAFDVRMRGCANCEVTSPSHAIKVDRAGDDAIVHYAGKNEKIGDSLVLRVRDTRKQAVIGKQGEFLLVRARPELRATERPYRQRTWVIVDDVSASRGPMELRAQADLVDAFMRELDEDDRVAVVAFDVDARVALPMTRVMDVDRTKLRAALKDEGGVGATSFASALGEATKLLANVAPDDAMVVYLGDGVITTGPKNLDALRAQVAGKLHFIGVGVGDGPDTQTLDALAAATGGYATTIDLADDLGWRAFDLVAALHTPRVTNLEAKLVDATGALVPATAYLKSAQLADGEELELVAKLAGGGTPEAAVITGLLDGKPWEQRVALAQPSASAGYLPRLWAQRHVAARLLAKHEPVAVPPCTQIVTRGVAPACPSEAELREQRDEAIRKEVVELGKQYFLLSRHTSLIVLENDQMYAQYNVQKGTGDTWAPYKLPAKIAVSHATPIVAATISDDAELVRTPLRVFYDGGYVDRWSGWDEQAFHSTIGFGRIGALEEGRDSGIVSTRASLGLSEAQSSTFEAMKKSDKSVREHARPDQSDPVAATGAFDADNGDFRANKGPQVVTTDLVLGNEAGEAGGGSIGFGFGIGHGSGVGRGMGGRRSRNAYGYGNMLYAQRLTYPADVAFDDLTGFVPALLSDDSDTVRAMLVDAAGAAKTHALDAQAKTLLDDARRALPVGVLRWGDLEVALDGAHRVGWKRTTGVDLAETASFDGTAWTRRYAELDLDVTRQLAEDDVAFAFAHLPLWIADPAHYARWFEVRMKGPRTITLARAGAKTQTAFELQFDDKAHLVAIRDGSGAELVAIAWGAAGPISARVDGRDLDVGFTPQAIDNAVTWAHGASAPGVLVELPGHMPAYWNARIGKLAAGTPEWRHAQRQYLVSLAATNDRSNAFAVYEALRKSSGVELGDAVLASGGIASAEDKAFAAALAPLATTPVARYLIVGRAASRSSSPDRMKPEVGSGFVGALWTLREVTAWLQQDKSAKALERLASLGQRAFDLRLIATAIASQHYSAKGDAIARAWDAVATGDYRNIARAQAALYLANHGAYDAAAERITQLITDLDLRAAPPQLGPLEWQFQSSRRGQAGWQLVWATWRDKALAGNSFEHVVALLPAAGQHPNDIPAILGRAAELANGDVGQVLAVAQLATAYNQGALAQSLVEPIVKANPSRPLLQLAGEMALRQGRTADALAYLEQAQQVGEDEAVNVTTVRNEMSQLIGVARQLALQSTGAARQAAVAKAMTWATRWRAIDPGNNQIDQQAGELLLAVGDTAGAWRQLSSVIERDPMDGTGYQIVADTFERQGRVAEAIDYWHQAVVIDQTNPTHRLREAQALIAVGRTAEGDAILSEIVNRKWHQRWDGVAYQARELLARGKQRAP